MLRVQMVNTILNNMEGLTLEQLKAMGAKPVQPEKRGYTLEELQSMGAKPVTPITPLVPRTNALEGFAQGIAKGEVAAIKGLSGFGERFASQTAGRFVNLVQGKGFKPTPVEDSFTKLVGGEQNAISLTKPEGIAENLGFATEKIAEFLAPSSAINKAKVVATGLIKGTGKVAGLTRVATRSAIEGTAAAGITTLQQGEINEDTKVAAIVGSIIPIAGSATTRVIGSAGKRIQQAVIKPSLRDVKDGFKIENVAKYKVGGNLNQVLSKTSTRINQLSKELNSKLAGSNTAINLNEIYERTAQRLSGNKLQNFGQNKGTQRVLQSLKEEITEVAGNNGLVSLPEAQLVKRGAGTKGAWTFGNPDPDAVASEKVYNAFYNELKTAIEKSSPAGVREINKQLSELIPISNAVIRRIPIAERNNAISLTDSLGLFGAAFDPTVLSTMGAIKLSRSGRFANLLLRASEKVKATKNPIIRRVTGQ